MDNEVLVDQTENTEPAAENTGSTNADADKASPAKTYTEDELKALIGKKKAAWKAASNRAKAKELAKQNQIIDLLKAGTGKNTPEELIEHLQGFYGKSSAPQGSQLNDKELQILAEAEAAEIIEAGDDDVDDELERLAEIGKDNMTARDRALFFALAGYRKHGEFTRELDKIGIPKNVYTGTEFQNFAKKFVSTVPPQEIYNLFVAAQPKKEISTTGSVRNTGTPDDGIKDFYTPEEAAKFTVEDFNKNPKLWAKINESRLRWKKR